MPGSGTDGRAIGDRGSAGRGARERPESAGPPDPAPEARTRAITAPAASAADAIPASATRGSGQAPGAAARPALACSAIVILSSASRRSSNPVRTSRLAAGVWPNAPDGGSNMLICCPPQA